MVLKRTCLLLALPTLLLTACYENREACFDPDAANFDVRTDEACNDCCAYPGFNVEFVRAWGEGPYVPDSVYADAGGNQFRIERLRFYLGDIHLIAGEGLLPAPENTIEVLQAVTGDTTEVTINDNNALVATQAGNRTVGSFRAGTELLTGIAANVGVLPILGAVQPASAPASSPLSTQAGLLYDRVGGRGFVQASLEYRLGSDTTIRRTDVFGLEPINLPFPEPEQPMRGEGLTVQIRVDYEPMFEGVNLEVNPAGFATQIVDGLNVIGVQ